MMDWTLITKCTASSGSSGASGWPQREPKSCTLGSMELYSHMAAYSAARWISAKLRTPKRKRNQSYTNSAMLCLLPPTSSSSARSASILSRYIWAMQTLTPSLDSTSGPSAPYWSAPGLLMSVRVRSQRSSRDTVPIFRSMFASFSSSVMSCLSRRSAFACCSCPYVLACSSAVLSPMTVPFRAAISALSSSISLSAASRCSFASSRSEYRRVTTTVSRCS
mmetsp:Transcript_7654/g.26952  ORF Transcript_7654/g.26952 Transcript_7654/m.26952 type:complete len:221 (+) Transcript_7654:411-1073(+)